MGVSLIIWLDCGFSVYVLVSPGILALDVSINMTLLLSKALQDLKISVDAVFLVLKGDHQVTPDSTITLVSDFDNHKAYIDSI